METRFEYYMKYVQLVIVILVLTSSVFAGDNPGQIITKLQAREKVRILVTDSGLGGLSVAAEIDSLLYANKCFREAEVLFFNALPDAFFKYNNLPDMKAKAEVFSIALDAMEKEYKPDIILIACNTLSVVYPFTSFSGRTSIPVLGIVEMGAQAIADSLKQHPGSKAAILGTETTIGSNAHYEKLQAMGIDGARIVTQACANLETEIQADPKSDMVQNLIDFYLDEAADKNITKQDTLFAALCCTHYGYAEPIFMNKMQAIAGQVSIINPNRIMAGLFAVIPQDRYADSKVSVVVVSQAALTPEELTGVGALLKNTSPRASEALMHYQKLDGVIKIK